MLNSILTTICTVVIAACLVAIVAFQVLECRSLFVF